MSKHCGDSMNIEITPISQKLKKRLNLQSDYILQINIAGEIIHVIPKIDLLYLKIGESKMILDAVLTRIDSDKLQIQFNEKFAYINFHSFCEKIKTILVRTEIER